MRIMLTNDDGLHAPGIAAMYDALAGVGRAGDAFDAPLAETVTAIAPLTVQSATSHGVTFHQPLMVSEERVNERMRGVAVDGRPADCVKLAMASIWEEHHGDGSRPDLVVSGINMGANCGINVIYSGTVAAALESAFLGVPSVALSLHLGKGVASYDVAAVRARRTIEKILEIGLTGPHACININLPIAEHDDVDAPLPPIVVCPMNTHGLIDKYERRASPGGTSYYWSAGSGLEFQDTTDDSDVHHLFERSITVTPLWYDLTHHELFAFWKEQLG